MAVPGRTNQEFTHKSPTTTGGSQQIQDSPNTQKESCIQRNEAVKVTIKLNVLLDSIFLFTTAFQILFYGLCIHFSSFISRVYLCNFI